MFRFYSIIRCFDRKYQLSILILILLMMFIIVLELLSIGIVIPFVSGLLNSNNQVEIPFFDFININQLNFINIIFLFGLIYLIKTFALIYFQKLKFLKIFGIQKYLSHIVLNNYLKLPTENLIKINTSEITRNVLNEVHLFIKSYLMNILDFILELFVIISLVSFLVIYDPVISLSLLGPTLATGILIYFLSKNKILEIGIKRQKFTKFTIQSITEIFSSIIEIKIYKKEIISNQIFDSLNHSKLDSEQKQSYYLAIPRIILEFVVVIFILFIVLVNLDKTSSEDLITILALLGVASIKIFPAINKIVTTFQRLKFVDPAVKLIKKEVENYQKNRTKRVNQDISNKKIIENWNLIEIKNLDFAYDKKKIFNNLNLKIKRGDKICLLGESGEGKTTLLNLIMMLLKTEKEYLYLDNKIIKNNLLYEIVSYLPQDIYLFDASIKDNITFMDSENSFNKKIFEHSIKISLLDELIAEQPNKENEIVAEFGMRFSGGQKQRIGIARSIYKSRELLIFDESTSQLDQVTEEKLVDNLVSTNKTIIFVTHKKHLQKKFNRTLLLKEKNILELSNEKKN